MKQPVKEPQTVGLSPKVIAAALTGLATFLLTKLGLPWDPIVEQAINVAAPLLAAVFAPPGRIEGKVSHPKPPTW